MNNFKVSKNTKWKEVEINGEIKEIPMSWNTSSIRKQFKIIGGGTPSTANKLFWDGDIPWLGPKEMSNRGNYISFGEKYITSLGALELGKKIVPKNSIILSTRAPVGYVKYAQNDLYTNQGCHSLNSNGAVINNYVFYWLKDNQNILEKYSNGTTFKELSLTNLSNLDFAYPVDEQQQSSIASILSAQESIINYMETLIEKYETRLRYLSEELLSGRLRIKEVDGKSVFYKNTEWKDVEVNGEVKEIPVDWEVYKISDIFEVQRGSVLSKDYIKNNLGIYPVYSSATENNGSIGNIKTYMFDGEFLTWTTDGVYAGTVFYRNGKFNCTNICGLLKIKNNKKSIKGISYFVRQELIKHVNHIGNSKLMSNTVSNVELVYASQKELFLLSGFMSKKEDLVETQKKLLEKEKEKFNFLLNSLISGNYLVESVVSER